MKKDMVVSVIGDRPEEPGEEPVEMLTHAEYSITGDEIVVSWTETELTGLEGTATTLSWEPHRVVLTRKGVVNTTMEFEEGEKTYFLYDTPFGSAMMGLKTNRIRGELGFHGGALEVDYVLDINHMVVGRNRLLFKAQEPKESHIGDIRWPI